MTQTNVATTSLFASPTNPRKTFDPKKLAELQASIAQNGILQPLLVREGDKRGTYEVVDGERRRRVAQELALLELPVFIRELTDDEVRVVQLVSALQKDDLHPLEEADAYKTLIEQLPLKEVAARVGREPSYVNMRLTLCRLSKGARAAYIDGKIGAGPALVIARLSDPKMQAKALERFLDHLRWHGERITMAQASAFVQHNVMLRLKDAPFSVKDATLVPEAGACTACDKRSGAQPELFEEISKKDDLCTDAACHAKKCAAGFERAKAAATAAKLPVFEKPAEVKKHFEHGRVNYNSEYKNLDETCYEDKKQRTYRQILGDGAGVVHAVLKSPDTGAAISLVKKSELNKLLKAEGVKGRELGGGAPSSKPKAKTTANREKEKAAAAKAKLDAEVQEQALYAIVAQCVARVEKQKPSTDLLRHLAGFFLDASFGNIRERRGWKESSGGTALVRDLNDGELLGVLFECTIDGATSAKDLEIVAACKLLGVDAKKLTDETRKKLEAAAAAPKAEPAKAAAKPNGKAKPAPKKKGKR